MILITPNPIWHFAKSQWNLNLQKLTGKWHRSMMNHMKCRHLIVAFSHHKEYCIKKLWKFTKIVNIGYVHHLQRQILIISPLILCSSYPHRCWIVRWIECFASPIIFAKPTSYSTLQEDVKAYKNMHKIICNQKLSELEGFAIFHETWAQHLKGSALS